MNYPTETFYRDDEILDIYFSENRLYGKYDGEELSNSELVDEINALAEWEAVRLIKACGGPKRFRHAYRKLFWENPVKVLDRELKNQDSSLVEYLELSYSAGLNPLPALRARGIVVRFGGQNTIDPYFTNEDVIVTLNGSYVTVIYNPWDRETETRIVNKGLLFKIDMSVNVKRKYYSPIRTRENRRRRKRLEKVKREVAKH